MNVIIDNGSGEIKAGISGEDAPKTVFPNEDREDMRKAWRYTFDQLGVSPEECSVLMTEAALNPKTNREMTIQILFEEFGCASVYMVQSAFLALYASGRTTGVVSDSGFNSTTVVPIFEGYTIDHAVSRTNIGGETLTDYLRRLLTERGYVFPIHTEREIVRDIKEKLCYVSQDYERELAGFGEEAAYTLPDGQAIPIGNERFRCPEAIFQPELMGLEARGIAQTIVDSISRCDVAVRGDLFKRIVLSGGNMMFDGMAERIKREIEAIAPASVRVNVAAPPERKFATWIGGSILTSLSTFESMWVSRAEYDEVGASIVFRKCI